MEEQLVMATWGLVVATFLLFLAALVPVFEGVMQRRRERRNVAASLIPDMNILRSRLQGHEKRLHNINQVDQEIVSFTLGSNDDELKTLSGLLSSRDIDLLFINEIYVLRHQLTQACIELNAARRLFREGTNDGESVRKRDEHVRRACRLYGASLLTLSAAEDLVPEWARSVDGEKFWDRFSRLSREREEQAGKQMVSSSFRRPRDSTDNAAD